MAIEERERLLDWLLANGGPVVRYRTAAELCTDCPHLELDRLAREVLAFPLVQQWLSRLKLGSLAGRLDRLPPDGLARLGALVHGSKPTALENVLGKLNELGLRAGMPRNADLHGPDEAMLSLMQIYDGQAASASDQQYSTAWESLIKSIFAWGLLRAGFSPSPAMQDYLCAQVSTIHRVVEDNVFDIYAVPEELTGLPKAWAGKPILKPEVMARYHLPLIHDLYMLGYLPSWLKDSGTCQQIDEIVSYVLDPRFQAFAPGYGYAWIKERRTCYAWGWSPHLVGFDGLDGLKDSELGLLIQQMELMARFPRARRSAWFQAGLRKLEWYRTESGIYCFPPQSLRELPGGYYVNGAYLGLGENRRTRRGLEIESTFRMVRIRTQGTDSSDCFDPILL